MAITNTPSEETALPDENARLTNNGIIPGLPVQLAAAKTKGGLNAVKAQEGMLMDEKSQANVLQNMQKLADEIQNPWRKLNEGLKDVNAWTMYNKAPAFALREEAANTDRSNLFNIRQQQAAFQNAQLQLEAENKRINALMGRGGVGGAGGAGSGGLPANVITALNAVNPRDIAAKQAIIDNYYKTDITEANKAQYNPASFTTKPVFVAELSEDLDMNPFEAKEYAENGKLPQRYSKLLPQGAGARTSGLDALPKSTRQNNPGNLVDTTTGQIKTFPTPQAGDAALTSDLGLKLSGQSPVVKERFGPQVGNFMSPSLLAETWAPSTAKGNSPESTQNYGKAIANSLGMADPTAQIPNTPESLAKAKAAITKFEAGNNYPAAPAGFPAAAPSAAAVSTPDLQNNFVKPFANPINSKQVEQNIKAAEDFRKANLSISEKEGVTRSAKAGESYAQMSKLAETADLNTIPAADSVLKIATDPSRNHVLGYLHGGNKVATALFTASKHISNKTPAELEEEYITNKFSPKELADYRAVQNSAQKLGIDFAADVFKGARMGIGLEKMAMGAKGIGAELPPEINAKNARLIRDAGEFQVTKKNMFEDWAKTHGGKLASFDEFEATPEYVNFREKAKNHFINTYKGLVTVEGTGGESPQSKAQAELNRRLNKKGTP
jgi:hypothetical protein